MQANPRSLDALFNSQLRYVVPMFQRLYVWQENPQWTTLWEDVSEKAELQLTGESSNPHYLGALIIEGVRPSSPREVKRFLVIDGQQRLTTLQLIFCAYRDIARKYEWKTLDRATTRYLENVDSDVMENPDEELFKLWPTTLNRDIFRSIITAGSSADVSRIFPLIKLPRKRNFEPRSNLVEAYLYFSKSIEEWILNTEMQTNEAYEKRAFALLQALQQDFSVVEIALSDGDDSQEIFYSLNSQGRPLSQSDLLRSLIFMRAEKEKLNRDIIFDNYWSEFESSFWSSEIKRGGRTYSRLDLGLRYFLMAKTGQMVDARRVNEEYRKWISANPPRYPSVVEELTDFSKHSQVYKKYETAISSNLPSTDLKRILIDFDVSTALPLIAYLELEAGLDENQLLECNLTLESFIARRVITGEENKEYNKFFVEVLGSLRGIKADQVHFTLHKKLLSGGGTTRIWPSDEELTNKVINKKLFKELRTPALRLILERLELFERNKKSESTEIPHDLQIEHILPQSWSTYWLLGGREIPTKVTEYPRFYAKDDLVELVDDIEARNKLLQTLGNLTLLNKYLNPAASNGSYEMKIIEYKNSVLRMNRYFDHKIEWNEESIKERGKLLGEQLCKIWPKPLS
ncbi:MAG: DUF262 domain-containing HNH endonuclease family protein [Methylotenera sp.]